MPKPRFQSIDEYIHGQPAHVQPHLVRIRAAIRRALPRAEEYISYNLPSYRLAGKPVIYFAAWKQHYSVYPVSAALIASLHPDVPHEVEKGTVRFPYTAPVPVRLIDGIVKLRAAEVSAPKAANKRKSATSEPKP